MGRVVLLSVRTPSDTHPAADIARREPSSFLGANGHDRDVAPQLDSGIYQPGNGGKPGDDTGSAIKVAAPGDGIHVRSDDDHVLLGVRSGKRHIGVPREIGCDLQSQAATVLGDQRSEEHTSELQSLMRISYAVFCLQKTTITTE